MAAANGATACIKTLEDRRESQEDRLHRSERAKLMSRTEIKDPCSYGEVIPQNIHTETRQCGAGLNGNDRAQRSIWDPEELELATVVKVDDFEENGPWRTLLVSTDGHE